MRLRSSRLARVVGSLVVVGAVAGITLGATTLLGVTFQGSGEAQQEVRRVESLLLTSNRDRLAICVQGVGADSTLEATAKSSIETALIEVAKHPRWEASGLGAASPLVDIGCPAPPAALQPGVKIYQLGDKGVHVEPTPIVEEASYYRLFVFILSPGELERIFGPAPSLTLVAEEAFRSGDEIIGVTVGLYLSADQLGDPQSLSEKLKRAVGLWEPKF